MSTFEATRRKPTQEHFYIVEIDLPIITGLCEITAGNEGYGTPLSCPIQDGTSAVATKTYRFGTSNTPLIPLSPIHRCLSGVNEQATELTSGKGLAIRGRATISFIDFIGDTNPERDGSHATKENGTFFGKLVARNVMENREVRVKKYRVDPNNTYGIGGGSDSAEISYYVSREMTNNGTGKYSLTCADELSKVEFDQAQLPVEQSSTLRLSIDDGTINTNTIPVDLVTDWTLTPFPYVILIGEEFMTVTGVTDNQGVATTITVETRGNDIGAPNFTQTLTKTVGQDHTLGDEIFVCITFNDTNIADGLKLLLEATGIDGSVIPIADWYDEIALWHPSNKLNCIFYTPEAANKVLLQILEPYLLDMWFDPIDREIKLKAISEWQVSSQTLELNKQIDYESITTRQKEDMRFNVAFIQYDKPFLSDPEESTSYKKNSLAERPELAEPEFYGRNKTKKFNFSHVIDSGAADLLVVRYVQRFGFTPIRYFWKTQERMLSFKVGDVVNVLTDETVGIDGLPDTNRRAQITKIQPVNNIAGREYKVEALTYQSAASANIPRVINSGADLNLHVQAGAPALADEYTFILDGGDFVSTDVIFPAITAGAFPAGSKLIIILRNGADWQSKGGNGGGYNAPSIGGGGGIVYSADGIDTDIYLGGLDPLSGTADGFLRAPGGGGGASGLTEIGVSQLKLVSGGGGGAGNSIGTGGVGIDETTAGDRTGANGDTIGNGGAGFSSPTGGGDGGGWGVDGVAGVNGNITNGSAGGLKGKGLVKTGAVVTLFGDTPVNFINGGGDLPD